MKHFARSIAALIGLVATALLVARPIQAEQVRSTATPAATASRPFRLPFADPPGPGAWYLGQGNGNTLGAYFQRDTTYRAGQGLHFGLDFDAPCGTIVVAIGDSVVAKVDAPEHGALPHNLLLQLDGGYSALSGHLLERSKSKVGERVMQGQPVGLSG